MFDLSLSNVSKHFGTVNAVVDVDLHLDGGKMVSFLGPSGCGKTTLLRLIAGLEHPSTGHILFGERDITDTPSHRRNVGMVFQSLALFPHLSVGDNIGYGLKVRGVPHAQRSTKVDELLELVRLPGVADRHISQLSGGQRQRVAIARALALKPDVFLLDEPLSALDANLREAMQIELRQLQQRLGVTTIVVTHDQGEAMTMSDVVVVMSDAQVQQVGPPLEVYRKPANRFVAEFIGTSNLLPGQSDGPDKIIVGGRPFIIDAPDVTPPAGKEVNLLVRPEDVHVLSERHVDGPNKLSGTVDFIRDVGATVEIMVQCDSGKIIAMMAPKDRPQVGIGDLVTIEFPAAACVVLEK